MNENKCGYLVYLSSMVIHWPILALPNLPRVWSIMLSRMTRSWACCRYVWDWEDRQVTHMFSWSWTTRLLALVKLRWPFFCVKPISTLLYKLCPFNSSTYDSERHMNNTNTTDKDWRKKIIHIQPKRKNVLDNLDSKWKYRNTKTVACTTCSKEKQCYVWCCGSAIKFHIRY